MNLRIRLDIQRKGFTLRGQLDIGLNGITALFGPSGCGKTTILRSIAGLDRHRRNRVRYSETTWQGDTIFIPPHQRPCGFIFQEPLLFSHLSIRRNIEYGLRRNRKIPARYTLDSLSKKFGFTTLLSRRPETLSRGERQRVAIAQSLSVDPDILLMDEPLSGMDTAVKRDTLEMIRSLASNDRMPIIYVSHDLTEIASIADRLILMTRGRILAHGSVEEVLSRMDLPLAQAPDAFSIVTGIVIGHSRRYNLTTIQCPFGPLVISGIIEAIGQRLRLRIAARDVSIALDRRDDTSILNIFPAVVIEMADDSGSGVTLLLDCNGISLLCRITRLSAEKLGLKPGMSVFAQVKGMAVCR